jgi:hypothetical protein
MNTNDQIRLTDELERQLMLEAMITPVQEPLLIPALKSGIAAVSHLIGRVLGFIGNVNDAMDRAHARSAQYAGSQW